MGLEGKTIAITGAARGLGAALAIVAADRGMIPLLLGRNAAGIGAVAEAIEQRTGNGRTPSSATSPTRCR